MGGWAGVGATSEQHEAVGTWRHVDGARPWLETHEVVRICALDMFPATAHVEVAVYLRARRT